MPAMLGRQREQCQCGRALDRWIGNRAKGPGNEKIGTRCKMPMR